MIISPRFKSHRLQPNLFFDASSEISILSHNLSIISFQWNSRHNSMYRQFLFFFYFLSISRCLKAEV